MDKNIVSLLNVYQSEEILNDIWIKSQLILHLKYFSVFIHKLPCVCTILIVFHMHPRHEFVNDDNCSGWI